MQFNHKQSPTFEEKKKHRRLPSINTDVCVYYAGNKSEQIESVR